MRLAMRTHLMTLAIVVLALLGGAEVGWAQNKERIDKATKKLLKNFPPPAGR